MSTVNATFSSECSGRLASERMRLGMSQADAARVCEVSREVWGRYERGVAAPGAGVLRGFAQAGADVRYILVGDVRSVTAPGMTDVDRDLFNELIDLFWNLSDGRRRDVLGIARAYVEQEIAVKGATRGMRRSKSNKGN